MKPQWNAAFFNAITQYDEQQQAVIAEFLQSISDGTDSYNQFDCINGVYELSFTNNQAFALYNDEAYALIDATSMQPTAKMKEYYVPLVTEGKLLLAKRGEAHFIAYLFFNELQNWQVFFLSADRQ